MAQAVPGFLGYDVAADRPLVKLVAGTKKLLTEDDTSAPAAHAASHENAGTDEINVAGLSGVLADAQVADKLKTSGTAVSLSSTPPTAGQVLQATSATAAGFATISSGKLLQLVRTESASASSGGANMPGSASGSLPNTLPVITDGTAHSAIDTTITPLNASSNLLISVDLPIVAATGSATVTLALFRDSTANAITCAVETVITSGQGIGMHLSALVAASSTSATTFKVRYGDTVVGGSTIHVGQLSTGAVLGGGCRASMTITEIGP